MKPVVKPMVKPPAKPLVKRLLYRLACGTLVLPALALATGCTPTPPPPSPRSVEQQRQIYTGPLHPLPQIVSVLAGRSAGLRTLWSRHDFAVRYRDARGTLHDLSGDGVLLVRKPASGEGGAGLTEVRLQGNKDVAGQVVDLGVNRQVAWLTIRGDVDTQWLMPTDRDVPAGSEIPIRPDWLADLLGIQDWSTDLSRYPAPVLRYDEGTDEYVLTLVEPAGSARGGLVARRDVRVARTNLVINSIGFYGDDGRLVAQSRLGGWQSAAGYPAGTIIPTDVVLELPKSNTNLRFTLRDMAPKRGPAPSNASFAYPGPGGVGTVERVGQ